MVYGGSCGEKERGCLVVVVVTVFEFLLASRTPREAFVESRLDFRLKVCFQFGKWTVCSFGSSAVGIRLESRQDCDVCTTKPEP